MGCPRKIAALIAFFLFACTAYLVQIYKETGTVQKSAVLASVLNNISGWQVAGDVPLDASIVKELELDDYIYQRFQKYSHVVTLYIGYYLKQTKIGAAHDPLVCFPGQGWVLSEQGQGSLHVPQFSKVVEYATMTATRGVEKERILYWFQAADTAVATTFNQKIAAFVSKIEGKGGESAFVRMSCSVHKANGDCDMAMRDFAASFYPRFHRFVINTQ